MGKQVGLGNLIMGKQVGFENFNGKTGQVLRN